GAVGLLVVFDDREPGAADRYAAAVERVHEFAFGGLAFGADRGAARLKSFAVGAGRDFAEGVGAGEPDFDVVGLCRSETHVAGGKEHDAIVEAETLQNRLGIAHERFEFVVAGFGTRELKQLDLLELVLAQDAARVASGGAGFGAEAGGPGAELQGE